MPFATTFSRFSSAHLIAFGAVLILHIALAFGVMIPKAAYQTPLQQVMKISLVAPAIIKAVQPEKLVQQVPTPIAKTKPSATKVAKRKALRPAKKKTTRSMAKAKPNTSTSTASKVASASNSSKITTALTKPIAAAYLRNPAPNYPKKAKQRRQEGTVQLSVLVATSGKAKAVSVANSSGHRLLDKAALAAVKRWKFVPAKRGSQSVEASVIVPVEFRIN